MCVDDILTAKEHPHTSLCILNVTRVREGKRHPVASAVECSVQSVWDVVKL